MVAALDDQVGFVVDELKRTNQYDNTVIVFTSDNVREPADSYLRNHLGETPWQSHTLAYSMLAFTLVGRGRPILWHTAWGTRRK